MICRICKNSDLRLILDLGYHPPSDAFLTTLDSPETWYPLRLYYCDQCGLAQIDHVVKPELLFNEEYPYMTGVTPAGVKHFRAFVDDLDDLAGKKVLDIGSNDGTLLEGFKEKGCEVWGIEPCKHIALEANRKGIQTINMFFGEDVPFEKAFDIITATNVFAHVDDLHGFMRTVDKVMAEGGIFIIEAPAFDDMIKYTQFDQIYHEHLSYLSPGPVSYLAEMHGFELYLYKHNEMHGGSYRYFLRRHG